MNTALYDPEQERIKSSILMAQALRKQGLEPESEGKMLAGFGNQAPVYVSNTQNNQLPFLRQALGQYQEGQAMDKMQALMNARQNEEDAFLAARPSETINKTVTAANPALGTEYETGNFDLPSTVEQTIQVPKPYQTLAQETRDWTSKAPRYSPLGGALKLRGMEQAINAPEKMFEREEAAKLRAEAAAEAAKVRTADQQVRLEAAKELQRQRDEAAKERAQEAHALRLSIAGLAKSGQNANADIQREILEEKLAALKAKNTAGPKLSAAEEKRKAARDDLTAKLTNVRSLLEANPDAVGLKTMVPDIALQRMSNSGERMTRAALAEMAAEKAHALYGAAFTTAEQKRANQFLPASGDSYEALIDKIANMEKILAETGGAPAGGAPAAPAGQSPEDIQALIWASKPENQRDPRAIQIRNNLAGKK
jgi:hypothetical protein